MNLIEVLVASAILAALFLPVFSLFRGGVKATRYTEDRLRALTIAQEQIQSIRHALSINRYSVEQLVRRYQLDKGGRFPSYVVDDRYRVTTEVDVDYPVEYPAGSTVTPSAEETLVTWVRVRVEWILGKDPRELVLETYVDRAYE